MEVVISWLSALSLQLKDAFPALSVVVAVTSAVVAASALRNAKRALRYQALLEVQRTYRSHEMLDAVRSLWDFHREARRQVETDVKQQDGESQEDYNRRIAPKLVAKVVDTYQEEAIPVEAKRPLLHYQRRLVSHFYQHMQSLVDGKVLTRGDVYRTWSEPDLRIIPNVLLAIEKQLAKTHDDPAIPADETDGTALGRLYRGAVEEPWHRRLRDKTRRVLFKYLRNRQGKKATLCQTYDE